MDNEHSGSMSSGSGAVTSAPADIAAEKIGLSARAGAALSKVSETAQLPVGSPVRKSPCPSFIAPAPYSDVP